MKTEINTQAIKDMLPRGFGPTLAARAKKSLPFVYDVMSGRKYNADVIAEALKMVKEEAKVTALLEKELKAITA
jgi:hypothetical protein